MDDRFQFRVIHRAGRFAVVRELHSVDVAGYDAVADRNDEQRHFQIHRGPKAHDAAFQDSRQYETIQAAINDAADSGRQAFI